ncbi:ABC-type amino acid transport substrate-binding protein [Tamilnaduibacter salinus]|uniref:ABC-type amino acid transport substrate-binding protein n=1 Tax=Tamilnaduibacter salinus TaxID=1484056 RepID=A0A2U1CY34_9GAMM|nr:transporter substrate-binding domain-containing protein [Tamilnaduibacter salinus]PVY77396.1 ABC-type amino acid transport substrate-binding protein [Tamilnaduibacter salinus]
MRVLLIIVLLFSPLVQAASTVRVGAYPFPPLAGFDEQGAVKGLLSDLLDELNRRQDRFRFEVVETTPKRRYRDYDAGRFDVIFFESPRWSWQDHDIESTFVILRDAEVYIALDKPDRDQSFFDNLAERQIVGVLGYHYGFAGFDPVEGALKNRFNITMSRSHARNLKLIQADRPSLAEVAVVTRSYLSLYAERNPDRYDRLLVSDKIDQAYRLRVLVRPGIEPSKRALEGILKDVIADGTYRALLSRYHLPFPESLAGLQTERNDHR